MSAAGIRSEMVPLGERVSHEAPRGEHDTVSKASRRRLRLSFGKGRHGTPGAPPGTILSHPDAEKTSIRLIAYNEHEIHDRKVTEASEVREHLGKWPIVWVDVEGLADAKLITEIGDVFGLHRLAMEDVVNVHQRAKVEQFGNYLFIVARMVDQRGDQLHSEQISIFLGRNFVVSFQEGHPGDCLDSVRRRLQEQLGALRGQGPDFLAYALIDAVLDGYFPVLEHLGERLETYETQILAAPDAQTLTKVHHLKREFLTLRRAVWPHREAINSIIRDPGTLISKEVALYFRDAYDHTVQIIELVEMYREYGSDLTDIYLSSVSNRLNEVMKVMTIISTIFIPLSFIASVYGMNFDYHASPYNMPELRMRYGYPFALGGMAFLGIGLILYFQRRGWLGALRFRKKNGQPEPQPFEEIGSPHPPR